MMDPWKKTYTRHYKKERILQMNYLWKIVRNTMAVIGGIWGFLAVGTSDYYVIELGQAEPQSVNILLIVGTALMLPSIVHFFREELRND